MKKTDSLFKQLHDANEKLKELTEYIDLIEFMEKINYMRKLYKNQRYTQAEKERDKLIVELDDVMRL